MINSMNGETMEKLFDSHAHYYDSRFAQEGDGAHALLTALFADNVGHIINIGTDIENSKICIAQAAKYENMYCTVGIHPSDGLRYADPDAALADLEQLLGTPESRKRDKIVALGEIGLDYHWDADKKTEQAYLLEKQLLLAEKHGLPVVIHDREAHGDCFDAICRHPQLRGVFHSYSGSAEMAKDLVRRGWYISFSGVATFKNAPKVREAIAAVPDDRILIETDAPYLAPVPHRGKMNHSGYMYYTAEAVAAVKGIDTDAAIRLTAENAKRLFDI
ncbi:MAG: TatD family deoxyribonuclease [Ruminococcaceae bacterium]|nr:TatD family deoxyribonuclease [Oscillospiraceae bacterium]